MARYLRSLLNGVIFDWNERLALNTSKVEEITEEQAYPERFAPPHVVAVMEAPKEEKTKRNKKQIALETAVIPVEEPYTPPELGEQAARNSEAKLVRPTAAVVAGLKDMV